MAKKKKSRKKAKKVVVDVQSDGNCQVNLSGFEPSKAFSVEPASVSAEHVRTVTVVAETVTFFKQGDLVKPTGIHKMECGRIAAQVGHVISRLKAQYAMDYNLPISFIGGTPITNIVLKARDNNELDHIMHIADQRDILCVRFYDDNKALFGDYKVLTAIALGPVESYHLEGITDYLPLYKCACEG